MAGRPLNPAAPSPTTPPATWSQSSAAFTSRSTSNADDSDVEYDPTPLQSPRDGPHYDDLPPSYDEAQHQAVSDARNGVTPLDPNQIEAHRLTLNEGPDEPVVWEYRIRGEELEEAEEHEKAPEYENFTNELGTHVPVQHVQSSESIPVGWTGTRTPTSNTAHISRANLLERALTFTYHKPDADTQYAPRLSRRIAIPPQASSGIDQSDRGSARFLRAYAKALHAHNIRPAEFTEFLDGLNALIVTSQTSMDELLRGESETIVHDYIRGANEGFFGPRDLRISLQSVSALIAAVNIPTSHGQRDGAVASVLDSSASAEAKARALYPWIEALETNVPAQSARSLVLLEMAERLSQQDSTPEATNVVRGSSNDEYDDPPHSVPNADHSRADPSCNGMPGRGRRGRRAGRRGGPPSHFGAHGHGPAGASGAESFVRPGRGPFGSRGRGNAGPPAYGARGPPVFGRNRAGTQPGGPGSAQSANEMENLGQNLGKWGEEFGKRMGEWGQQFGKQAEAWGQDIGNRAELWSSEAAATTSGGGNGQGSASVAAQGDDMLPPSCQEGRSGQESGVLRGNSANSKGSGGFPDYEEIPHHEGSAGFSTETGKKPAKVQKDDDASSLSSDSSDLDFDSDSDSESDFDSDDSDVLDTQASFITRIASINKQAEDAIRKGKKGQDEITKERDAAIEKAHKEKIALSLKLEERTSKRAARREHLRKHRDLKREYRDRKRALRAACVNDSKGKGKGKAKKTPEWKQAKREFKDKRKALKKERSQAREEWKESRSSKRIRSSGHELNMMDQQSEALGKMVWVVIENLSS